MCRFSGENDYFISTFSFFFFAFSYNAFIYNIFALNLLVEIIVHDLRDHFKRIDAGPL